MEYSSFYVSFLLIYKVVISNVAFTFEMIDVNALFFLDEVREMEDQLFLGLVFPNYYTSAIITNARFLGL